MLIVCFIFTLRDNLSDKKLLINSFYTIAKKHMILSSA